MERVDKRGRSKEMVLAAVKSKNLKGSSSSIGKDVRSSRIEAYVKRKESKRKQKKKKYRNNSRRSYDSSSSESSDDSSAVEESLSSSDSESSREHRRKKSKQKSRKMASKKSDDEESLSSSDSESSREHCHKKSNKQSRKITSKKRNNGNRHHHKSRKNGPRGGNDFDGAGDDSILKSPHAYLKDPKMYGDFSPYHVNDMVRVSSETSDMEKIVEAVVVLEDSDGDETDDSQ